MGIPRKVSSSYPILVFAVTFPDTTSPTMPRSTKMIFSKSLTQTDTKKRLAIPSKVLNELPEFNGSHAEIPLMYGTRVWQVVCSVRKVGYKKPVFSRGWREFVSCNDFSVGDVLTLYKVQEDDGSFHYRVEVQKPATRPSGDLSHPALSVNHEVDEITGTGRGKFNNLKHEKKPLIKANDAPFKEEGAITEPANAIAIASVVGHVSAKSPNTIFRIGRSDETASKAQFKNEREPEIKNFGTTVRINTGMSEPFWTYCMTKPFDHLNGEGGSVAYDGISHASADACYKSVEGFSLDLLQPQPAPYEGEELNLELTLAQPIVDFISM